ncbi:hypothetical protein ACFL12_00825 [Pseudomonadota bacterium]
MPDITAEQAAEQLAQSVILTFAEKHALEGRSAQITNITTRVWNDIIEALRLKTQACGGGLLNLHELDVVSSGTARRLGVALFFIGKTDQRGFIGATWHEDNLTCAIYGRESEFPPVLKSLLDRHKEVRT